MRPPQQGRERIALGGGRAASTRSSAGLPVPRRLAALGPEDGYCGEVALGLCGEIR